MKGAALRLGVAPSRCSVAYENGATRNPVLLHEKDRVGRAGRHTQLATHNSQLTTIRARPQTTLAHENRHIVFGRVYHTSMMSVDVLAYCPRFC